MKKTKIKPVKKINKAPKKFRQLQQRQSYFCARKLNIQSSQNPLAKLHGNVDN